MTILYFILNQFSGMSRFKRIHIVGYHFRVNTFYFNHKAITCNGLTIAMFFVAFSCYVQFPQIFLFKSYDHITSCLPSKDTVFHKEKQKEKTSGTIRGVSKLSFYGTASFYVWDCPKRKKIIQLANYMRSGTFIFYRDATRHIPFYYSTLHPAICLNPFRKSAVGIRFFPANWRERRRR